MAGKSDQFYFQNFIEAADCSCRASLYLNECLSSYRPEKIEDMLRKMHELEHKGDEKRHEVSVALAKAFVTPFDREDLAELSQCIDEVTDGIEEALQCLYMHNVQSIKLDALPFAKRVSECCSMMKDMLTELGNFKKPARLKEYIINLNHAEEDCDRLYLSAVRSLRSQCTDAFDVLAWHEIYKKLEKCADACEHVADSVERIVMKNT